MPTGARADRGGDEVIVSLIASLDLDSASRSSLARVLHSFSGVPVAAGVTKVGATSPFVVDEGSATMLESRPVVWTPEGIAEVSAGSLDKLLLLAVDIVVG